MILLFNIFLTETGLNQSYKRSNPPEDKLDIFKASLSSIAGLYNWTQVIIKFKLDKSFEERESELIRHIEELFPEGVAIFNSRNESQIDWIETCDLLNSDPIIFYSCNHDHFFVGNPEYFRKAIETFSAEMGDYATMYLSHFPEIATSTITNKDKIQGKRGEFLIYDMPTYDSFIIITKKLFESWWKDETLPDIPFPRSDYHPYSIDKFKKIVKKQLFFAPLRELFRHYDGYSTIHNNYKYFDDYGSITLGEKIISPPIETIKQYCAPEWYWAYEQG